MKIDIAKKDLLNLRRQVWLRFETLRKTPAWQSEDPSWRLIVKFEMESIAKLVKKLNRALVKAYGHDCNAHIYPVDMS